MRKLKEKTKSIHYMHYIAFAITIAFVLISIFVFPNAYTRIGESLSDLWNSLKYYVKELFFLDFNVSPSVIDKSVVPFTPIFNLPATWEEFVLRWSDYWQFWASLDNFKTYLSWVADLLFVLCQVLLLVVIPFILISYMTFKRYLSKENNDYNKDSKPLKFTKWLATKTYIPVKNWLKQFWAFLKESKYLKIWLFICAFNFNFLTIVIEFIAYYLYFVISFDTKSIYLQIYKLFCDLSVILAYIPLWAWFVFGYMFIVWWRKKIGYSNLQHFENKNCGFINERPIAVLTCGTMGKSKTTITTDMALSQEKMLRDKAFEKLIENDLKFPHFPFINLENAIKYAIDKHIVYNLASTKKYIKHLSYLFYFNLPNKDKSVYKSIRRHLKKRYNLDYKNLCFDYDIERYGLHYDDNLKLTDLWEILETYAQLYLIYITQSSLIISNYSIRTDNIFVDLGNFPLWDTDFFKRDSRYIDAYSRHAHILDFDALRLGKRVFEDNPKAYSLEFGVINMTEIGKERKNNLELTEIKKKDTDNNGNIVANQKNDLFNACLKIIRHKGATVDNFPFIKILTDEQRPESWGADARDLTEIIHIDVKNEMKLTMPFFIISELLYDFVFGRFVNLYTQYRHKRADNTLPMYLLKKFSATLHQYYTRTYNLFGYFVLDLKVENGTQDGQFSDRKYYLMPKKIYSKRFSTDCYSEYFTSQATKYEIGLDDWEEYETEKASVGELDLQNSYWVNELKGFKDK